MRYTTLLALLTGVMLYLGMGALVFRTLEAPKESSAYTALLTTKRTFLDNNSCVTEVDFHRLLKGVVSAVDAGLDVSGLSDNFTSRWDGASAFFFCGTIITTIGFGNLSPRTWYGQLFCVCYALVGIPMFGILLAGVSDHMGTVLRRAVGKIETLFLKRMVKPTTVRVISAVLSILIGCLIFLAVPTVVFQKVEDWSFLESLYFVVITLTTVGFGDYVPGGGRDGMFFKPLVWLWIVFGLAYFASILTMIGNWLRVLSQRTRAEMEELRAHATDWTQNIQNMSMDFRIPNPLEFNDPFLLQRRKWKRSERRRMRRGAQGTLGYWVQAGAENGYLPGRWAGLSSSMSRLHEAHSSLERAAAAAAVANANARPRAVGARTIPRAGPGLTVDPAGVVQCRSYPHLLARSFSVPVSQSTLKLEAAAAMAAALEVGSVSGSESPYDSRSDGSSASLSYVAPHQFRPCGGTMERGGTRGGGGGGGAGGGAEEGEDAYARQEKPTLAEKPGSDGSGAGRAAPPPDFLPRPSPSPSPPPLPSSPPPAILLPSPPLSTAYLASCQLLDFFGENLAYIDESSDTLSDRAPAAGREERRKRPRKPKKRSMRRQLPHRWSPLQTRRADVDMQPPSNPPTPPPDPFLNEAPSSQRQTDSATAL